MRRLIFVLPLILLFAAACGPAGTASTPSPNIGPTLTERPATATPPSSPTPAPGAVVLLAPDGDADPVTAALTAELERLASDSGLHFERGDPDADPQSLPDPLALLVAYRPEPELVERLLSAPIEPGQLVAVAPRTSLSSEGLVTIGPNGLRADRAAFLAGYTAAVLSDNYRVGVVSVEGVSPVGAASGFTAGARYYCGLCRAAYPPFSDYPASIRLPNDPSASETASVVERLGSLGVRTVYLAPGLELGPLPAALAEAGISLLAHQRPEGYPEELWLAEIRPAPEAALSSHWEDLLSGEAPDQISVPLTVSDRNPQAFTDPRYRLVEEVLQDLVEGYIDTGVTAP